MTIFQFDPPIFQEYSRNSSMRLLLRQPLTAHRIAKTAKNRQKSSQISRERKAQPCSRAFQAEWALSLMTPSPISKLMSKLFHQHLEYVKNMYVLAATRMSEPRLSKLSKLSSLLSILSGPVELLSNLPVEPPVEACRLLSTCRLLSSVTRRCSPVDAVDRLSIGCRSVSTLSKLSKLSIVSNLSILSFVSMLCW